MVARAKARYEIVAEDRTRSAFDSVNASLAGLASRFKVIAGAAGIGLVTGGLQNIVDRTVEANNRLADLAVRLGTNTQTLSELRFAAEATNVRFESLITSMQRLSRRTAEAVAGNVQLQETFTALNIDAEAFSKLPLRDRVRELAQALTEVDSSGERLRLAFKLLDSEGVALLQTFRDGATGLEEFARQAEAAGVVVTDEMAESAREAQEVANLLDLELEGIGQTLGNVFTPAVDAARSKLLDFVRASRDGVSALGAFADRVIDFAANLVPRGQFSEALEQFDQVERRAEQASERVKEVIDRSSEFAVSGTISDRGPLGVATDDATRLLQQLDSALRVQDRLTTRRRGEGRVVDTRFEGLAPIGTGARQTGEDEALRQLVRALLDDISKRKTDQLLTRMIEVLERQDGQVAVVG